MFKMSEGFRKFVCCGFSTDHRETEQFSAEPNFINTNTSVIHIKAFIIFSVKEKF